MRRVVSRNQRQWIVSVLLIALFVRALIPAGFMPAMDRPLSFQICPDGYPAHLLRQGAQGAHAHHPHGDADDASAFAATMASVAHAEHGSSATLAQGAHDGISALGLAGQPNHSGPHTHGVASGEHCVFAAVAAIASFTFNSAFVSFTLETSARDIPYVAPALARERFLLPPSRGPPALS